MSSTRPASSTPPSSGPASSEAGEAPLEDTPEAAAAGIVIDQFVRRTQHRVLVAEGDESEDMTLEDESVAGEVLIDTISDDEESAIDVDEEEEESEAPKKSSKNPPPKPKKKRK